MRKNLPVTDHEHILPPGTSLVSKTDLKGRITYGNPAFVEASGFGLDELLGAAHSLVRHPDMPPAAFADLWATIQQGKPWSALVKNRRKNGDFYWVRANVTPVIENGAVVGYMSVRDVPSRVSVAAAEELYRKMRAGTLAGVVLKEGTLRRTGLVGWLVHFGDLEIRTRLMLGSILNALVLMGVFALGFVSPRHWALLPAAVSGACVALLVGRYFAQVIGAPLQEALAAARNIAAGKVDYRTETARTDECGLLLRALQQAGINLTAVVQDIQKGSATIHRVTGELAGEMHGLSDRTQAQAASLEETAASMEELTATVRQNATNIQRANEIVVGAAEVADRGGRAVDDVVGTMGSISTGAKKIREIIAVIDEIAFQTNILALNASVEAARAGDQGRGFAVVASEVRSLAQRSAQSAKEIKTLIVESVEAVDRGAVLAAEAGRTIHEVVRAVGSVTSLMGEIARASSEQSTGIDQVGRAVVHMDQITQHNATLVHEASTATEKVGDQTKLLDAAVQVFNVPHLAEDRPAAAPRRLEPRAVRPVRRGIARAS